VWDVATGTAETARFQGCTDLKGRPDLVTALFLLPGGRLASGSFDGTIVLWDIVTSTEETPSLDTYFPRLNAAVCVLPDRRLATGSWDKTIRLWDLASGSIVPHCASLNQNSPAIIQAPNPDSA
jgi:WD40 repeat protein